MEKLHTLHAYALYNVQEHEFQALACALCIHGNVNGMFMTFVWPLPIQILVDLALVNFLLFVLILFYFVLNKKKAFSHFTRDKMCLERKRANEQKRNV